MIRPFTQSLVAICLCFGLAACDETAEIDVSDAPLRTGDAADEAACVAAVNRNYGSSVASVVSSEFSQANTDVRLTAQGENWRCLSSGGTVAEVSVIE
ncbi:hypothetical protein R5H30_01140 [Sulfitobacter sp. D35]|uniref:hypothetical protein n=1 Tax=Sulfitobacter sp. D35 TaxID=3083252 RepID=UPI00296E9494|nr:hypothetical protein [Sulfitobacter sp. D35]MDW4496569.1 hypothetical protein [Sulfitobacter sp. D35]